jgi:hypothetical protein
MVKLMSAQQPFFCTAALDGCARRAATTASTAPHPPDLIWLASLAAKLRSAQLGPLERLARYNAEAEIPRYNTLRRRRGARYVQHNARHVTIGALVRVPHARTTPPLSLGSCASQPCSYHGVSDSPDAARAQDKRALYRQLNMVTQFLAHCDVALWRFTL